MGRPLNLHNFGDAYDIALRNQIKVTAYINGSAQDGYLVQQKNRNTFKVIAKAGPTDPATGKNYTALCKFVNSGSPIAGQMSLQATTHSGTPTNFYVSKITNRYAYDFTVPAVKYFWGFTNVAPPTPVDYPTYDSCYVPYDSRPADPNEAP